MVLAIDRYNMDMADDVRRVDVKEIGRRMRAAREAAGISRDEIAEYFSVTRNAISNWENGDRRPDIEVVLGYADRCNVTLLYLLGVEESPVVRDTAAGYGCPSGPFVMLPVYQESAALSSFTKEAPVEYHALELDRVKDDVQNYLIISVTSDAMRDIGIMPGGKVLMHRQSSVDDEQIAVVCSDGEVLIRRVRFLADRRVLLLPANPNYREEVHALSDVIICGRVVQAATDY